MVSFVYDAAAYPPSQMHCLGMIAVFTLCMARVSPLPAPEPCFCQGKPCPCPLHDRQLHVLAIPASQDATDWKSQNFMQMCDFWGLPCSFPLLGKTGAHADWTMNQLFGLALKKLPPNDLVAIMDASDSFLSASQQSIIEKYDNITSGSGAIVMSHNAGCAATGCRMAGVRAAKHVQPKVNPHQVNDGFHMGPANILSGLWASFGNRSATQSLGQLIKSHPEMVSIDHEQQLTATIPWWEWNAHFEVVELPNPLHAGEKMVKQRVRNRRTGTMPSFFHLPEATEKMRQNPEKQAIWTVHFDQLVGIAVPVAAHRRRRTVVGWPFEICKFKTEGPCRHPPSELCCGFDRDKPGESCPNGFRKFIV